jgi:hypothetical protein
MYDWWVLGLSCSVIWKCPSKRALEHYNKHIGSIHLDVGVGTGFFLDRATFPTDTPEITLFDLNSNSLRHCARRIARHKPKAILGDALEPNELPREYFQSIGINFLLHCLPDGGDGKWRALDYLLPTLTLGGTLFGSSILGSPLPPRPFQRWLMSIYNRKGIFSNTQDSRDVLHAELHRRFEKVEIEQEGVIALFAAQSPRREPYPR